MQQIRMSDFICNSGSQSVVWGSQEIHDQFPGDPWIHFCNGYFDVYLFF